MRANFSNEGGGFATILQFPLMSFFFFVESHTQVSSERDSLSPPYRILLHRPLLKSGPIANEGEGRIRPVFIRAGHESPPSLPAAESEKDQMMLQYTSTQSFAVLIRKAVPPPPTLTFALGFPFVAH